MEKKLTIAEAKELSIKKWENIVKYNGSDDNLLDEVPEVRELLGHCGFCEYANQNSTESEKHGSNICNNCPIKIQHGNDCVILAWGDWYWSNSAKKAVEMLNYIKDIKTEEDENT